MDLKQKVREYMKKPYKIYLLREPDGDGWTAGIEEFPGCITQGDTLEEVMRNLEEAKELYIETALMRGKTLPEPKETLFTRESKSAKLSPTKGSWFAIAIVGMKDKQNFGSVLRAAVNWGAKAVFLVNKRFKKVPTDTLNAMKHLPIIEVSSLPKIVGVTQVYVDFNQKAVPIEKFNHPKQALYVFGPEDGTLEIPNGKTVIYVPTKGSLNLAVSVGVILYDRYLKQAVMGSE